MLRRAILKQYRELTYEEIAFHLQGFDAFRSLFWLEMGQYPSKSGLRESIKATRQETWEVIDPHSVQSIRIFDAHQFRRHDRYV